MNRNEKIKVISQAIYDDYIEKGWKNVSIYDCEKKAIHYVDTEIIVKKLTLTDVSQQRELLLAYEKSQYETTWWMSEAEATNRINDFLSNNCG